MKKKDIFELDFIIDRLTESIVNALSGDSFLTEITLLKREDLFQLTNKSKWKFNWKIDYNDIAKEVYKLTIVGSPNVIQGLISISIKANYVEMNLLESAPHNIGINKVYECVAGNLVAYACKISFQKGFEGYVAFYAKNQLIEHYKKTLGAYHFKDQRMFIEEDASRKLVEKYFKV